MTDDQKSFDPRFDPAFQRGFDGPTAAPSPATSPAARLIAASPETRTERPPAAAPEPALAARWAADRVEQPEPEEPATRTTNPFLITLGVLAVALIGLGLYLFQSTRAAFLQSQSSSSGDYITMQTVIFAAPMCIALGVATGIGVLFIYAIRFRR